MLSGWIATIPYLPSFVDGSINSICYLVTDHIIHKFGVTKKVTKSARINKFIESEKEFLNSNSIRLISDSQMIVSDLSVVLDLPKLNQKASVLHIGWPDSDETESFELPPGRLTLCIGAVYFRKGTQVLLKAWDLINADSQAEDCYLFICGPLGDDHKSEEFISRFGSGLRIHRITYVTEKQKSFLLNQAVLVVIPSNNALFGVVGIEAIQKGCQVVASNIGGLIEVLDNAATFFHPGDSIDLASKLRNLLSGIGLISESMNEKRASCFSYKNMILELDDFLK